MCAHAYDENYFCKKCGYTNLNLKYLSKVSFPKVEYNCDNKVQFDYVSDLHLEFWCKDVDPNNHKTLNQIQNFIINILKPKTDNILIIAGDLGHYPSQIKMLLLELKKFYKHILIVNGNHDMYLISNRLVSRYKSQSYNRILEMKEFCKDNEGLYYLDGDVVEIEGITFGGVGMWHDNSYANVLGLHPDDVMTEWSKNMNDSKEIYFGHNYKQSYAYGYSVYIPSFKPLKWFESEKKKLDKIKNCKVLISHVGPIVPDNIPEKYKNDVYMCFYYFDGKKDIDRIKPKIWIHGHSHGYYEHEYNDCKIYCNTIGYPSDNLYNEIKTLEI